MFRELEVEAYFGAFERIAGALSWPVSARVNLLQCKLFGKAQKACATLSGGDNLDYERVKGAILRTYGAGT